MAKVLTGLFFLREYRCNTKCGWHGIRFSASLFRRKKKRLSRAMIVLAFLVGAAATVRYMLAGASPPKKNPGDEGIGVVDP
jgi:hypothetical protein